MMRFFNHFQTSLGSKVVVALTGLGHSHNGRGIARQIDGHFCPRRIGQFDAAHGCGLGQPLAGAQLDKGRRCDGHRGSRGLRHLALQFVVVQSQGSRHLPDTVGGGQSRGGGPEGCRKSSGRWGLAPTV